MKSVHDGPSGWLWQIHKYDKYVQIHMSVCLVGGSFSFASVFLCSGEKYHKQHYDRVFVCFLCCIIR